MLPTDDLGTPVLVTPSEMARFLRRDYGIPQPFSTAAFAAYFGLTVIEAQEMLNQFAGEGLLTFLEIRSGMETWVISREGRAVFQERARRLKKDEVAALKKAIASLAPILLGKGVVEVSIAGRPVLGKPNGMLLVGLRLSHEPFSHPGDSVLLTQVCGALLTAVDDAPINVFLFFRALPGRLKQRVVLAQAPSLVAGEEPPEVDEEETQQDRSRTEFLRENGCSDPVMSVLSSDMPLPLARMLAFTGDDMRYPVLCRKSPVNLSQRPPVEPESWESEYWYEKLSSRYPRGAVPVELIAQAEYFNAIGKLDSFCNKLTPDDFFRLGAFLSLTRENLKPFMLQALRARRDAIRQARATTQERKAKKRPPTENAYYAVFDTLSEDRPVLVGFVRQPSSNAGNIHRVAEYWGRTVTRRPQTASAYLASNGFPDGTLLLDRRLATEAEIGAFDQLSKRVKRALKSVIILRGQACTFPDRFGYELSELGPAPAVLAKAELNRPVQPRLMMGRLWPEERAERKLFDVVYEAPPAIRERLASNLVDIEAVDMLDFARKAALKPCIEPVVLASGLADIWSFSTSRNTWKADYISERWGVSLSSSEVRLDIRLWLDNRTHQQQLAPYEPAHSTMAYRGYLVSLYSFMKRVHQLQNMDVDASWTNFRKEAELQDSEQARFSWFVELVDSLLTNHSFNMNALRFDSHTSWPELYVATTEAPAGI